jgi:hypothetical protein
MLTRVAVDAKVTQSVGIAVRHPDEAAVSFHSLHIYRLFYGYHCQEVSRLCIGRLLLRRGRAGY